VLKQIGEALEEKLRQQYQVDTTRFGDPFAAQVAWTPLVGGGQWIRTHNLVHYPPARWEFRPTLWTWALTAFFVLCALGLATIVNVFDVDPAGPGELDAKLVAYLLAAMFLVAGVGTAYLSNKPIVFDRDLGAYWRGGPRSGARPDPSTVSDYTPLRDIYALQIITKAIYEEVSWDYQSYELNLVLRDGRRVHVVDHRDGERLRADAAELSRALSVPVWDPTAP
jgi:hypothetical protein